MADVDVVVAAYPLLGLGLCSVLEDRGRRAVAVHGTAELSRRLPSLRPRVVLVDAALGDAAEAVVRVLEAPGDPSVVVLGDEPEDDDVVLTAACAGASGVLSRAVTPDALDRALHAVTRGESLLPRRLVPRVIAALRAQVSDSQVPSHGSVLTGKERQVLAMMQAGLSTATIAERLVVAPVTVRTHVCAIRRKLKIDGGLPMVPAVQLPARRQRGANLDEVVGHLRIS
jgi:DNA-binding NarL/FixJ family response regulator